MGISFIEFRMERVRRMRMIVLVASTRVFGDSLGKMILLLFAYWVFLHPFAKEKAELT